MQIDHKLACVMKMDVQNVYDGASRQTGVIVPIHLWNKISLLAKDEKYLLDTNN